MTEVVEQANKLNQEGETCLQKGDIDLAISHLEKAISCDPGHAQAYNNLACAYVLRNNYPSALEYITKAYELDQTNQAIVLNTGDILTSLGELDNAILVYRTYLDTHPNDFLVTEKIDEVEKARTQTRSDI